MFELLVAASSSVETYGGQGGSVAADTHAGGLPITGLDVAVLVAVAIVLVLAGLAMARFSDAADGND